MSLAKHSIDLLEVVSPILDVPRGRFYFCGTSHDGRGYQRVDGNPEHVIAQSRLDAILARHPGLTADHPYFEHPKAVRRLKAYQPPSAREKHLHNHEDYQFYDETLP